MNKIKFILLLCGALLGTTAYSFEGDNDTTIKLEESVITTTGFERSVRDTTANVTIVTDEDIKNKGYQSVEEVLRAQPSINVTDYGSRGLQIDLRGQGSNGDNTTARDNVKILVNGVSIVPLNTHLGELNLNGINIDNIAQVEIIPGGGAILYGNGTAGGVINIITKTGTGLIPFNNVGITLGSYNKQEYNVSAGTVVNDNLLIQTNLNTKEMDAYVDGRNSEGFTANVLTRYKIDDKSSITFNFEATERETSDISTYLTEEQYSEDRNQIGTTSYLDSVVDYSQETSYVVYDNKLTDNLEFTAQGIYSTSNKELKSTSLSGAVSRNIVDEDKIEFKPKFKFSYGDKNSLTFGYDYLNADSERNSKSSRGESALIYSREIHSLFALNSYKLNKFDFIQGIRYSNATTTYEKKNYTNPTASVPEYKTDLDSYAYELSANYLYSDTGNTYIKWESGFNLPYFEETYNDPDPSQPEHNGFTQGPSDVDEETYNSFEIGVKDFVFGSYVSLSAFYSITDDEIAPVGESTSLHSVNINIDETTRAGVELNLEQYFGKLTLTEGYSYTDAELSKYSIRKEYEGNDIPGVSKHSFILGAKYDFAQNFNMTLNTTYKSKSYTDFDNKGENGSYILTDLTFNHELENGLKLSFGINNLFNEKYAARTSYSSSTGEYKYKAADERNYFMSASYKF